MSMIFLSDNYCNTTTQIYVDSANTLSVSNIIDRNVDSQWMTIGYATNTSTILSIEFDSATSISRIFLQNHNLKQFRIFYNSATANTFTPNLSFTTNSEGSNYLAINTVTVNSIQIQCDLAMTDDTEKKIGEIYIGNTLLSFERNPSAANYKPTLIKDRVIHRFPNKGVSTFVGKEKFKAEISWKFVTNSFTSQLLDLYTNNTILYFVPFPTSTAWDGIAYNMLWTNDFDFKYSDNNTSAGQGGKIVLEEIA